MIVLVLYSISISKNRKGEMIKWSPSRYRNFDVVKVLGIWHIILKFLQDKTNYWGIPCIAKIGMLMFHGEKFFNFCHSDAVWISAYTSILLSLFYDNLVMVLPLLYNTFNVMAALRNFTLLDVLKAKCFCTACPLANSLDSSHINLGGYEVRISVVGQIRGDWSFRNHVSSTIFTFYSFALYRFSSTYIICPHTTNTLKGKSPTFVLFLELSDLYIDNIIFVKTNNEIHFDFSNLVNISSSWKDGPLQDLCLYLYPTTNTLSVHVGRNEAKFTRYMHKAVSS